MEKEENKDVHTEHCCARHGCKYCDENCPVFTMKKEQSCYCEDCESEHIAGTPALYIFPRDRMMAEWNLKGKIFLTYAVNGSGSPSISSIDPEEHSDSAILFGPIPTLKDIKKGQLQ